MGAIFKVPGYIVYGLGLLWGIVICLGLVIAKFGIISGFIGLVFSPVTLYISPWYFGFTDSNWHPLMVVYGSGIAAIILISIGSAFDKN